MCRLICVSRLAPPGTHRHTCAMSTHVCIFSSLSKTPGSWQPQSGSRLSEVRRAARRKRAQTAASHFPLLQSKHYCITPRTEGPASRKWLKQVTRAHSCVTTAREDRAACHPSPCWGPPRPRRVGSHSSAPHISAATPERTEMAPRGPEPGSRLPSPRCCRLSDLQRSARLCTSGGDSAITHSQSFLIFVPMQFIPGDGTQSPVRHNRTLSFIRSECSSCIYQPRTPALPPPSPPSAQQPQVHSLCLWVCFCLVDSSFMSYFRPQQMNR